MNILPTLTTDRLILHPFKMEDASRVRSLAGEWKVAATTANIPHPYEEGMAEAWIGTHLEAYESGKSLTLAIQLKSSNLLIGAISLQLSKANNLGELGYWIGVPYWSQGYCTEAGKAMLVYGFDTLGLNRIQARHIARNPASGRVMQKLGMQHEGTLRQSIFRWDRYEDAEIYAILREAFEELSKSNAKNY